MRVKRFDFQEKFKKMLKSVALKKLSKVESEEKLWLPVGNGVLNSEKRVCESSILVVRHSE